MDYKEKYEWSLERAKKLHETCDSQAVVGWCEYIFPELKESEDELTWLTKYIEEEAYWLSLDIRDDEDRINSKNYKSHLLGLKNKVSKNSLILAKLARMNQSSRLVTG